MDFDQQEHVAVIGMAGRFPGAGSTAEFWSNLRAGVESISRLSPEELAAAGIDPGLAGSAGYVNAKGLLDGIDLFDAAFFGFSPREAEITDPQQRFFLECAWEALEDAGYDGPGFAGSIGVFAACGMNMYLVLNLIRNAAIIEAVGHHQIRMGNRLDNLATRTSYKLNLKGPSINVQTGCSSSLVAVHLACQSLLSGESDIALAGGVRINALRRTGYEYQEGSILSPDGHCRAFDERAAGTVGGDGVGIVVLKRLSEALRDGDAVRAVVLGSAVNNDGMEKIGYTAPSVEGQARVIVEAMAMAGVEPEDIQYVETHGTGTPLGDPIEIAGLTKAFRALTSRRGFCAIGSVKTNIGHLDTASGAAGLIKTVLALQHRQIPPSLHFERPNPKLDLEESPFRVNARLADWPADGTPRRAGVSSFGIGGTNAHVVLQEAPAVPAGEPGRPWHLLVLSAKTPSALDARAAGLAAHLRREPGCDLADVEWTLQRGRAHLVHRRALVCREAAEAAAVLAPADPERVLAAEEEPRERSVAFLFSGQGTQHVGMGRALWLHEPAFRNELERCARLLAPHLGVDLCDILYPPPGQEEEAGRRLAGTDLAQPALFAVEHALARLWMSWGVQPRAMAGHSIGEYVAACLAGVLDLEDALALVAARGRLMAQLPPGAMLAVPLAEDELRPLLGDELSLAAVNGPGLSVASGAPHTIEALRERLAARGLEARPLHVRHAFHSAAVDPLLERFAQLLRQVALVPPRIPYLSNLTGTWITAAEATDPEYWSAHLRQTVRFGANLDELLRDPDRLLLEVGPGRTLCTLARQARTAGQPVLPSLPHPRDEESLEPTLTALGRLWAAGVTVDWEGFHARRRRRRIPLPTYPFERQRYWVEPDPASGGGSERRPGLHKRSDLADWFYAPSWRRLPKAPTAVPSTGERQRWLLLVPAGGPGYRAAALLRAWLAGAAQEVVVAREGRGFGRLGDLAWELDPADPAQIERLLAEAGEPPDRVVHLWCLPATAANEWASPDEVEAWRRRGFDSLRAVARALARLHPGRPADIVAVASELAEVVGGEPLSPAKTTLLGAVQVIPQEVPGLQARAIDAGPCPDAEAADAERWVARLLAELDAPGPTPLVALRGGHRWRQAWEPQPLPAPADGAKPRQLRDGGVYLITGGLGRIGLVLAELLAQEVRAKLVLTSRSEFPPRYKWEARLAAAPDDRTAARIRRLLAIEERGAEVLVVQADVADPAAMSGAAAAAHRRFGALHGVLHAAGVTGSFHSMEESTPDTDELHFGPKLRGLLALREALAGERLDWVVLLSSLSAALGGNGYAAHAAAHLFLDLAAQRQSRDHPYAWVSFNFDGWSFGTPERARQGGSLVAQLAITATEGAEVFRRLFDADPLAPRLISTGDLEERAARGRRAIAQLQTAVQGQGPAAAQHARPDLGVVYAAPRNETEQIIAEIWQGLLGIERVGITDDFFDLGGHSLLGVQLVSRLREAFGIEVPVRRVFEETTVAGLAAMVEQTLIAEIERMSDDDVRQLLDGAAPG